MAVHARCGNSLPTSPMDALRGAAAGGILLLLSGCMVSVSRTVAVPGEVRPGLRRSANSVAAVREGELAEILTHDPGQRRPRLAWNPILAKVARERAWNMAVRGYFAHVTP